MQIAVLGAGMVGRAIALDLAGSFQVTSFDLQEESLNLLKSQNSTVHTKRANLQQFDKYANWFQPFDLVVSAVPGFMGYKALETLIGCSKQVVDISFFPENALLLDDLAKEKGVTVITDCGVAPGMSNLILGHCNANLKVESFACYVGGLPLDPEPPFFYKAPFSPVDVIQEYIRPARLMEKGRIVTKPALSDREILDFGPAGELEAFNTDGLRSLLYTMKQIPDMKEKTLRYPGHIDLIISLQQAGFFDSAPVEVEGKEVAPLALTSQLLLKQWKLGPTEAEFTVMKVIVSGEGRTITWDLYDQFDTVTGISSMARSTGYTCTAAVQLIVRGLFIEKGVFPPELIGRRKDCFDFVLDYLKERRVNWTQNPS